MNIALWVEGVNNSVKVYIAQVERVLCCTSLHCYQYKVRRVSVAAACGQPGEVWLG